jgi:hypothetical protein
MPRIKTLSRLHCGEISLRAELPAQVANEMINKQRARRVRHSQSAGATLLVAFGDAAGRNRSRLGFKARTHSLRCAPRLVCKSREATQQMPADGPRALLVAFAVLQLRASSPPINFIPLGVHPHVANFAGRRSQTGNSSPSAGHFMHRDGQTDY